MLRPWTAALASTNGLRMKDGQAQGSEFLIPQRQGKLSSGGATREFLSKSEEPPRPGHQALHLLLLSDSPVKKVSIIGDHDGGLGLLDMLKPSLD